MAYNPSPIQRESVITRAAEEICRLIEGKGLGPGELLPPETHLSQMLGISRNSVREALRVLHGLGFVEKLAGRGVVVRAASGSRKGIFDKAVLREAAPVAHEVRMLIEQRCAELASERITAAELTELEGHLAVLENAASRKDFRTAVEAHEAFHAAVLSAAKNPLLVALFNQARMVKISDISMPLQKTFADRRHWQQQRAILNALRNHDAKQAAAAVQAHFHSVMPIVEFVAKQPTAASTSKTESSVKSRASERRLSSRANAHPAHE